VVDLTPPPLSGVRVLDFGRLLPPAVATTELARYGADVTKVEFKPHGDYLRQETPHVAGVGDMHLQQGRGKRSLLLDPGDPATGLRLHQLVNQADVVVVSASESSLERLGIDYATLSAHQPRVIYCSLTGFGSTGPYSDLPAHGLSGDAAAGLVGPEVNQDDTWAQPYVSIGPRAAGLYAASGIMAALAGRGLSGRGRRIEVSLQEAALAWGSRAAVLASNQAGAVPRYSGLGHAMRAYRSADDRWLLFTAVEPSAWRRFCTAAEVGEPLSSWDRSSDGALSFVENEEVQAALGNLFESRTLADWLALARAERIPISPFVGATELLSDEHLTQRGAFETVDVSGDGTAWAVAHPVLIDGERWSAGTLREAGADNEAVLQVAADHAASVSATPYRPKTEDLSWRRPVVARSAADTEDDVADLLGKLESAGLDLPIVRLIANSRGLARPFVRLADALMRKTSLPPRLRELVILRLGGQLRAEYEVAEHRCFAAEVGLTADEVEKALRGSDDGFSDLEVLAMRIAVSVSTVGAIDDEDWTAFVAATSEETTMELLLTVAWWGAFVPTIIKGLQLDLLPSAGVTA
jgi:alpha-methylacyl-CoA racemase